MLGRVYQRLPAAFAAVRNEQADRTEFDLAVRSLWSKLPYSKAPRGPAMTVAAPHAALLSTVACVVNCDGLCSEQKAAALASYLLPCFPLRFASAGCDVERALCEDLVDMMRSSGVHAQNCNCSRAVLDTLMGSTACAQSLLVNHMERDCRCRRGVTDRRIVTLAAQPPGSARRRTVLIACLDAKCDYATCFNFAGWRLKSRPNNNENGANRDGTQGVFVEAKDGVPGHLELGLVKASACAIADFASAAREWVFAAAPEHVGGSAMREGPGVWLHVAHHFVHQFKTGAGIGDRDVRGNWQHKALAPLGYEEESLTRVVYACLRLREAESESNDTDTASDSE